MSDSIREQIMKNIQTTLQGITIAGGYANELTAVERVLQRGQSSTPPMAYVLEGDDNITGSADSGPVGLLLRRTLTLGVVLVVQQDEDIDAKSASEVMNSLIADVQKALQVDYQRGGLAIDTLEDSVSAIQQDEGMPTLSSVIAYRIDYRHRRTDPAQGV
jgi:hypothetical protein